MPVMKIESTTVSMAASNCFFLINQDTREMICIDPGDSGKMLAEKARREGLTPVAVLVTHGHFDHIGGAADFAEAFSIPVYVHEAERATLADPRMNASWMAGRREEYHADVFVKDEQLLSLAGFAIRVLFTPGHTPGGCCYYLEEQGVLFSGDTLFCGSVGRTDFKGGSMSQLVQGIREKLLVLPEDTVVYPGHMEETTVDYEKKYNPFL